MRLRAVAPVQNSSLESIVQVTGYARVLTEHINAIVYRTSQCGISSPRPRTLLFDDVQRRLLILQAEFSLVEVLEGHPTAKATHFDSAEYPRKELWQRYAVPCRPLYKRSNNHETVYSLYYVETCHRFFKAVAFRVFTTLSPEDSTLVHYNKVCALQASSTS